jgi:hypothetical protein
MRPGRWGEAWAARGRCGPAIRRLGAELVAVWLVAGCGSGQSPTESGRLAEGRRGEALETPKITSVVDALFLGSGPLIPRDSAPECPLQGFWSGYPRGSSIRVRVSNRVPVAAQSAISGAVGPLGDATGGALNVTVTVVPESDPPLGVNEVTVTEVTLPRIAGCPSDAGCVQYRFAGRGLLMGARVVAGPGLSPSAYVHDAIGHGVLGLCHIGADQIGGAEASLMSAGFGAPPGSGPSTLTGLDLDAIRAVYASSVNPGAARSAFLAARLVDLQAGQLPRVP